MRIPPVILAFVACLVSFAASAARADDPQRWDGSVDLPGGVKLGFTVSLETGKGSISIPMQGVKDLQLADVSIAKDKIAFTLQIPGAPKENWAVFEYTPDAEGKTAAGALKQAGQEFKSTMRRLAAGEAAKSMNRPQEPKPPFPYKAEEVTVPCEKGGHTLAGTLTLPEGKGPFPAVILVTGSGPQNRDEALLGHKPFLIIADHLTRHGIAVLRYDDRGTAKSTGTFDGATSDDFADDAIAALKFLTTRADIDKTKLGVVGHSEGGLIAPMVAANSTLPSFIVLLAGPGIDGVTLLGIQGRLMSVANGMAPEKAAENEKLSVELLTMVRDGKPEAEFKAKLLLAIQNEVEADSETKDLPAAEREKKVKEGVEQQSKMVGSAWMRRFLQINPKDNLKNVKIPILAMNGELDLQVPVKEDLAGIVEATKGNKNVKTVELKGLNHLFQTCKTGSVKEYAEIEETFSPKALEVMTSWIREQTGLDKAK